MTVSVSNYVKNGLTPLRKRGGNYNSGGYNTYPITNGQAENIFKGDPVRVGSGTVSVCPNGGTPTGVFIGCVYQTQALGLKHSSYFPTGTSMGAADGLIEGGYNQPLAFVVDDPDATFLILARTSSGDAGLQAGDYAKVSAAGTGSTQNGQSLAELDITGTNISAGAAMFRVVGPYLAPGWNTDADNTVVEVIFNPNLTSNA